MKTRLDQLLVARGLAKSRAQAQALILVKDRHKEGRLDPIVECRMIACRGSGDEHGLPGLADLLEFTIQNAADLVPHLQDHPDLSHNGKPGGLVTAH